MGLGKRVENAVVLGLRAGIGLPERQLAAVSTVWIIRMNEWDNKCETKRFSAEPGGVEAYNGGMFDDA